MNLFRRTIHPEIKVLDAKTGIVEYVASDESVDSQREIIRAKGWRFSDFKKNAPFVNSHNYGTIEDLLGKVIDFKIANGRLIETVQWAIDVPENRLAQLGWKMTEAGYLKAVSVGFMPLRWATPYDREQADWREQSAELKLAADTPVRCVYIEQEQKELSACVIGANPNALATAMKAGVLSPDDLTFLTTLTVPENTTVTASSADSPDAAELARRRAQVGLTATAIRIRGNL